MTLNVYSNYCQDGQLRQKKILVKNENVLYTTQKADGAFVKDKFWMETGAKLKRKKVATDNSLCPLQNIITNRMKLITAFLLPFFAIVSFAQTKDLSTLPPYDCTLKKVMAIIGRPTTIASPDKSTGLDAILSDYCGIFGTNCTQKKEADLTPSDYTKDMLLVGICSDFRNWHKLDIPIRQIPGGFIINRKTFTNKSDGFVYVDTNRIIISGNSLKAVKDAQLALTGGHDILLVQNGKITYFGNRTDSTHFNWFNLQDLAQANYNRKTSDLFSAIYISKNFTDTINYRKLYQEMHNYVQQFLKIYKLKMPAKRVSWFLHANMLEYGTMSGMFGLTCPGNNSAGFSIRGEIHTNGFNTGLVKHEYSHFLFDSNIPQDNNPAFFVEGSVEYVTNLNDRALFTKRIETAKKFKDSLNYTDLIINNRDFYGQYSEANYAICGVFVKYIIDKFGIESFKKYCLAVNKREQANTIFKTGFKEVLDGYKAWLDTQ